MTSTPSPETAALRWIAFTTEHTTGGCSTEFDLKSPA